MHRKGAGEHGSHGLIRLIHTADVHLDASFSEQGLPHHEGIRRREALRETFRAIVRRATSWPADALLIAGDLFEHERVERDTSVFLRDLFAKAAPLPVFIAPGNCDPYCAGSPYLIEDWPANVHIFTGPEWDGIKFSGIPLTVYGFGFDGPESSRNPFGALRVPEDGRIHVAVAHGAEESCRPSGKRICAPFAFEQALPENLHYLALGHYHRPVAYSTGAGTQARYCGAPEPLGFSDTEAAQFLEVTVDPEAEGGPSVQCVPGFARRTAYHSIVVDCALYSSLDGLVGAVLQHLDDMQLERVVRLTLTGACLPAVREQLALLPERLQHAVAYLDLLDETDDDTDTDTDLAGATSLGAFVARVDEELRDAPDDRLRRMLSRARALGWQAYRGKDLAASKGERSLP